jgi:hypothetical protein
MVVVLRTGYYSVRTSLPIELHVEALVQFLLNEVGVIVDHVPDTGERLAGNSTFRRPLKKQIADVL